MVILVAFSICSPLQVKEQIKRVAYFILLYRTTKETTVAGTINFSVSCSPGFAARCCRRKNRKSMGKLIGYRNTCLASFSISHKSFLNSCLDQYFMNYASIETAMERFIYTLIVLTAVPPPSPSPSPQPLSAVFYFLFFTGCRSNQTYRFGKSFPVKCCAQHKKGQKSLHKWHCCNTL